jgi:putative transposase
LLLVVIVSEANISDQAGLKRLLAAIAGSLLHLELIKADEAYQGQDFLAWVKRTYQQVVEIVSRPEGIKGFVVQPQRWVAERTLAWLGNYRRLSKDYEVLTETSETFIYMAMVDIMTKRLANCSTPSFRSR